MFEKDPHFEKIRTKTILKNKNPQNNFENIGKTLKKKYFVVRIFLKMETFLCGFLIFVQNFIF